VTDNDERQTNRRQPVLHMRKIGPYCITVVYVHLIHATSVDNHVGL